MNKILPPERIVALGLLLVTLAVNISMPLFRVYAAEAGMGNGQTALVLATYIIGMLPCYIFIGGISDRIGRKPVLIASVVCAFLSTAIITYYANVYALIFARFFQGVGLGLSMGAGTAYISELVHQKYKDAPTRAANMASLATAFGFSGGALATTIVLLNSMTLRPFTYYILLGVTLVGIVLLFFLPNLKPIGGSILRLPYFPKGSFPVNAGIGICWAATGTVIAIIPSQLDALGLVAYSGFCLVLINWTGAFFQPFIRGKDPVRSVKFGYFLIPLGFGLVVLGSYLGQLWVILVGTFVIGSAAYGYSYVGGMAIISNLGGVQRARAVAGYMYIGYIGFGIPAIFLGFLADKIGIVNTLLLFEIIIIVFSIYLNSHLKKNK